MIQVFSNQDKATKKSILNQIKNNYIGGLIFSQGGPVRQAQLNNELQAASKIPLLVGMDAEWGLSMRLDSTYAFPWNMTLGAIKDLDLIRKTGQYIGEHCKRIGVHFWNGHPYRPPTHISKMCKIKKLLPTLLAPMRTHGNTSRRPA